MDGANPVRFGTDGWRALMGEEFTFANVRACARAAAEHFADAGGHNRHLVVGYDTRFLSDEFALAAARVLAGAGFAVQLADRPAPTPALSYRIVETGAAGGLIVTSSHNPFRWNGIKVKPHYGGSASPEIVADIEARVPAILADPACIRLAPADSDAIARFDPLAGYCEGIAGQVDLPRIRAAGLRVAVDPMYGAGAGLLPALLDGGATRVDEIHAERNPLFPGIHAPEPIAANLDALLALVAGGGFDAGIANDGDADRVGLVDGGGAYVDQMRVFALLVHYLLGARGLRGAVVKSVTATAMVRLLAESHGQPCIETPVGFKHIGPAMLRADALVGGEESGGYGFRGHLPERDGILAALLLLDAMALSGRGPRELLDDVFALTGPHFYQRLDLALAPGANAAAGAALDAASPCEFAGLPVTGVDTTDGWRFLFDDGWLLFRLSGTEPLLRIYAELRDETRIAPVMAAARDLALAAVEPAPAGSART